jgi:diketogulonate reductase-like aldo/keto reductase
LQEGYRLIDTATLYGNEVEIGDAIRSSGIPREHVFLTTKVWDSDQGSNSTLTAFEESLQRLHLEYVDLYLIHWPRRLRNETWMALEKIYKGGLARAIGVSNFTIQHLKELMTISPTVPSVNQVEFSPFLYQKELLEFCNANHIIVEAYCPLTRARRLHHAQLITVGKRYSKSPAQVLLRWGLQHGIIQIPKSGNRNHIRENSNIFDFELNEEDMTELDNMNENFRVEDDPILHE